MSSDPGTDTDDSTSTDQNPSHTYEDDGVYTVTLIVGNSCDTDTSMFDITITPTIGVTDMPERFALRQNYPNPFNPMTTIEFSLAEAGHASLEIFDVTGQRVASLVDRELSAGPHTISWRAGRHASGVYFARLTSRGETAIRRLVLIR